MSQRYPEFWSAMFRAAAITLSLSLAGPVLGQGLEIAPLSLDVGAGDALVQAAVAVPGAPTMSGLAIENAVMPAAVQVAAGRPAPSLILGAIAPGQEAAFGIETLLSTTVEQVAFALDDLAAREALRTRDPDLFRQLIEEGHVDPPADQLNRQLQVELARSNCYRSTIDGLWGPGSRRSVGEYFDELAGVSRADQEPSNDLFRAILINGDVACTAPVAAPVAAAPARTTTPTRTQTQTRTQAPAQTAPAQTQTQTQTPRLSIGGSGVFR
ncbi:MAG: hypothetical protein AAFP13_15545 [Pseudomonadota bacterium]